MVLVTLSSNGSSDKSALMHRHTRAIAARIQKVWMFNVEVDSDQKLNNHQALLNAFMPRRFSRHYLLVKSISDLRVVGKKLTILFKLKKKDVS